MNPDSEKEEKHIWKSEYILQPVKARVHVNQGRVQLGLGDTNTAESLSVDAVMACPNFFPAYQLLGDVLYKQGENELAAQAYLGELPLPLYNKYLQVEASFIANTDSTSISRVKVHTRESYPLTTPGRLSNDVPWRFDRKNILSNETWVDTVTGGSLWHDGHNTVVFDSDNVALEEHAIGNVEVINDLRRVSLPYDAGKRAFLLGARGGGNFYHWMTDILPKLGILRGAGIVFSSDDKFIVPEFKKGFQRQTLSACGISEDQVIDTNEKSPYIRADELVVPRLINVMGLNMGRWLPDFLQNTLLDQFEGTHSLKHQEFGERIFVSRDPAASNGRSIENIEALNRKFSDRGFDIVYPERLSLVEQALCFHKAEIIFSPHGAGLTNIVFCKPGTTVVEFYGAHIAPCYWAISAIKGLRYLNEYCDLPLVSGGTVDVSAQTLSARRTAGFSVDLSRLEQLFDLIGIE